MSEWDLRYQFATSNGEALVWLFVVGASFLMLGCWLNRKER